MSKSSLENPRPAGRGQDDPGVALMLAYQTGDEGAFDLLVGRYSGQVFGLLTRFMGPDPRREDLVQEVFLRVIRARQRYQPTARFSTWLYRITFNLCVNERQRAHVRTQSLDAPPTGEHSAPQHEDERVGQPCDSLERQAVVDSVREAIAALPEQQRMAIILAKYEEIAYSEIAQVMDSSEKAIKSLVHRARENLRQSLAAFIDGELAS